MISDKEFISVCENAITMTKAASELGIHFNTFVRRAKKLKCYRPNPGGKGTKKGQSPKQIPLEEILAGKHPQYQTYKLKQRLLKNGIKKNECEKCNLTEWLGKKIEIELHHIDGDRTNHKLKNLEMLCPNCHSQTDTFRAKNIK